MLFQTKKLYNGKNLKMLSIYFFKHYILFSKQTDQPLKIEIGKK